MNHFWNEQYIEKHMWNIMVFIKYSEAKHLRYSVNTKSFNLSDLPHKLIPTPMGFIIYIRQWMNQLGIYVPEKQKSILSSEATV